MKPLTDQEIIETPFEVRAEAVLNCAFYGIHHCPDIKKTPGEFGRWEVNMVGHLSTYDSDMLTRLVISGHDQCVRVSVQPSGPRMVKIVIHPRKARDGEFSQRHQTMEDAIARTRTV